MAPARDEHVAVHISAGTRYMFKTTGRRNLFPGFGVVYEAYHPPENEHSKKNAKDENGEEVEDNTAEMINFPELLEGEILQLLDLAGEQHFTKPPARYNDASLVKTLEEEGIGRPSTYAPTIFTLLSRDYVQRKSSALFPTELGETVLDLLVEHFPKVLDVQFTASMEEELDRIEEGTADWVTVLRNFYTPFKDTVQAAREQMKNMKPQDIPTNEVCEKCAKPMVIKSGRFGTFMACSGFPECRNTKSIPTGVQCPLEGCGGQLVKRMSKQRRTFYGCSNYPKCTHIANRLPRKDGEPGVSEDDKIPDVDAGAANS
jgi:DNA topoisomerase-1